MLFHIGFLIWTHCFAGGANQKLICSPFLASIGMLIHVQFLWNHIDILVAAVILVIVIKTVVVTLIVRGFRYNNKTSLLVCDCPIFLKNLVCYLWWMDLGCMTYRLGCLLHKLENLLLFFLAAHQTLSWLRSCFTHEFVWMFSLWNFTCPQYFYYIDAFLLLESLLLLIILFNHYSNPWPVLLKWTTNWGNILCRVNCTCCF